MKEKISKINETLAELLLGILFWGIAVQIVTVCFFRDKWYVTIGLWFGIILALAAAVHMWWSLQQGVDLGDGAVKYMLLQNMIRYGVIVAAFGILCLWNIGNPLAAFAGIMGLKASAYLQPFTHKIILKLKRR